MVYHPPLVHVSHCLASQTATFLFLIVLSLNRLGEEARKRLDPRESKI